MYSIILIPLENSPTDEAILQHIRPLAKAAGASLVLVHIADGFGARHQESLVLAESTEMKHDREYLARREGELSQLGFRVSSVLECGDPASGILAVAERCKADLIAMATHGHRLIGDLLHGSVADEVRHRTDIPVLMVRAKR